MWIVLVQYFRTSYRGAVVARAEEAQGVFFHLPFRVRLHGVTAAVLEYGTGITVLWVDVSRLGRRFTRRDPILLSCPDPGVVSRVRRATVMLLEDRM